MINKNRKIKIEMMAKLQWLMKGVNSQHAIEAGK